MTGKINNPMQTSAQVPLGGVIAWLKTYPSTGTLMEQFAECNGQVLNDVRSPYHGMTLPNFNGDANILYGAAASGTARNENFLPLHHHHYMGFNFGGNDGFQLGIGGSAASEYSTAILTETDGVAFKGYSVVWVVRVW